MSFAASSPSSCNFERSLRFPGDPEAEPKIETKQIVMQCLNIFVRLNIDFGVIYRWQTICLGIIWKITCKTLKDKINKRDRSYILSHFLVGLRICYFLGNFSVKRVSERVLKDWVSVKRDVWEGEGGWGVEWSSKVRIKCSDPNTQKKSSDNI